MFTGKIKGNSLIIFVQTETCWTTGQKLGYVDPKMTFPDFEGKLRADFDTGKINGHVSKTFQYNDFPKYMTTLFGRVQKGEVKPDSLEYVAQRITLFYTQKLKLALPKAIAPAPVTAAEIVASNKALETKINDLLIQVDKQNKEIAATQAAIYELSIRVKQTQQNNMKIKNILTEAGL